MKTLLLLRHAKSSWSDAGASDFGRPLSDRGRRVAPLIAAHLTAANLLPDLVLCSAARRTRETLALMLPGLPGDAVLRIESGLYEANAATLLKRLRHIESTVGTVLVIAHNPGLEDLATTICGGGDEDLRRRMDEKFPTAALAVFVVDAARWIGLRKGSAILTDFVLPKNLA
jgi:phosphohistidine phosphatase